MVEEQWWRWNNGGALMRFVLTIETEHSQHVNAIDFFFWWRQPGTMVEEQQTETNGETKA